MKKTFIFLFCQMLIMSGGHAATAIWDLKCNKLNIESFMKKSDEQWALTKMSDWGGLIFREEYNKLILGIYASPVDNDLKNFNLWAVHGNMSDGYVLCDENNKIITINMNREKSDVISQVKAKYGKAFSAAVSPDGYNKYILLENKSINHVILNEGQYDTDIIYFRTSFILSDFYKNLIIKAKRLSDEKTILDKKNSTKNATKRVL